MVTLLQNAQTDISELAWVKAAAASDAFAFLSDPAEDIYSATDGEPFQSDQP